MTLYIYRVGWTYPVKNSVYRSKSMKTPSCTWTLPGPVRPVGPCRRGHSASTGQNARSDRSDRLVPILAVNICSPIFFGKACLHKNILLNQNCLKALINNALAISALRTIKIYRPCLAFLQVDDETICFGLQTFFVIADLIGLTSTCCSINSCLRMRCSLLFFL